MQGSKTVNSNDGSILDRNWRKRALVGRTVDGGCYRVANMRTAIRSSIT